MKLILQICGFSYVICPPSFSSKYYKQASLNLCPLLDQKQHYYASNDIAFCTWRTLPMTLYLKNGAMKKRTLGSSLP